MEYGQEDYMQFEQRALSGASIIARVYGDVVTIVSLIWAAAGVYESGKNAELSVRHFAIAALCGTVALASYRASRLLNEFLEPYDTDQNRMSEDS